MVLLQIAITNRELDDSLIMGWKWANTTEVCLLLDYDESLADETDAADCSSEIVQASQFENDDRSGSLAPLKAVMTPKVESSPDDRLR